MLFLLSLFMNTRFITLFFVSLVSAEAQLTVEKAAIAQTAIQVGDTRTPVFSVKVTGTSSDYFIQSFRFDLGSSPTIYTKVFNTMYLVDQSGVTIALSELSSSTIIQEGSNYFLTLGTPNYLVSPDVAKFFTLQADVYMSIKAEDLGFREIKLVPYGVYAVDINGVEPSYSNAFWITQNLVITGQAIPEPSTWTVFVGIVALSIVVARRKVRAL